MAQTNPRPLKLEWGVNPRGGQYHDEWHATCGCAFHPEPFPHVHPCCDAHKRPDLNERIQPDPLGEALNSGDGAYRP